MKPFLKLFGMEDGNGISPFTVDMDVPDDLMKLIKYLFSPTNIYPRYKPIDEYETKKQTMGMKKMLTTPHQAALYLTLWKIFSNWIWRKRSDMLLLIVKMQIKIVINMELIFIFMKDMEEGYLLN